MSDNCFQIIKFLAVEYHNYESHTYRNTQFFFFFFFWNIKRSFQGLSHYFFHWYCGYIKFLQNAYEMCLYSQLSTSIVQFSLVAQSCPILCDPMNCSTPGLPVLQRLPEFTQTHVHRVGDAIQPSHPLLFPSPPAPNPSQHQGLFQWVNSSHEVAKVLEFHLQHPSFQHPGLISFRMDWLDLLAVQGTLKSHLQHHSSKASIFQHSAFLTVQLSNQTSQF